MTTFTKFAILLLAGLAWGSTVPLTKTAVSTGHHPIGLIVWQLAIAVVVLSVVITVRGLWPEVKRRHILYFLVIGLTGTVVPNSFSFLAAANLPAGVMAIVLTTVPMFTTAMAFGLRVEQFSWLRVMGILLGAIAVLLLIVPDEDFSGAIPPLFVLVALIAPFFYGIEGNYIAMRAPENLGPIVTLWGASLLGLIVALPMALMMDGWVNLAVTWGPAEYAMVVASLLHIVAYASFIRLINAAGPIFSSQIGYVVTIAGVFFSALALSESYSHWVWASLLFMLAGLTLVKPRKEAEAV